MGRSGPDRGRHARSRRALGEAQGPRDDDLGPAARADARDVLPSGPPRVRQGAVLVPLTSLTWDRVTAWRIARGHLGRRAGAGKLVDVAGRMCGAHAQIMSTVPLALAARVNRVTAASVDAAIERRELVKTWAMRGTLHVFAAADLPLYCAAQATRDQYQNPAFLE